MGFFLTSLAPLADPTPALPEVGEGEDYCVTAFTQRRMFILPVQPP